MTSRTVCNIQYKQILNKQIGKINSIFKSNEICKCIQLHIILYNKFFISILCYTILYVDFMLFYMLQKLVPRGGVNPNAGSK